MFGDKKEASSPQDGGSRDDAAYGQRSPLEHTRSFKKAILPVIACGAGLFSDGYINNVRASEV